MQPRRLLPVVVLLLLVTACVTPQGSPERTPLEKAKLAYIDGSLAYETAMSSLQDLRAVYVTNPDGSPQLDANGLKIPKYVTDAQWRQLNTAQGQVRRFAPLVRSGLDLWEVTGTEPSSLSGNLAKLLAAFAEVQSINAGVKR